MAEHVPTRDLIRGASSVAIAVAHNAPLEFKSTGGEDERNLLVLAKDLKTATDEVKTFAEKSEKELKEFGKLSGETKASADKALTEMNGISLRLTDIEQKMSRSGGGDAPSEHKSAGYQFIESEQGKAMLAQGEKFKGLVQFEVKNITSASATAGQSVSTGLVIADRQPGIVQVGPPRRLVIRDLLAPGRTESGSVEWVRETVFTNAAASVAENPAVNKPQSELTFDLQNTPARTIAHFVMASKQIMADAPMLQSYIDGRLRYGLAFKEDDQLLNGGGTGTDLAGLMLAANSVLFAPPAGVTVADATRLDVIRMAMLQATLALYPATGHILNPTDWAAIELTKDTQGRYIWANPASLIGPTLWGLPVAESLAMTIGSFMTGAFKYAAQIFDREDASVAVSTEDRDNFVKNMVTVLCEERLALAVYRPQALIRGTFAAGLTALNVAGA
jgi:HK97 family phage major capsid protein